jgi:dihydroflavonol-4-reductase
MNETVAVVGGTGFLGANIVATLADAGYTPITVARRPERIKRAVPEIDIEMRYGDITKPDTLRAALMGCTYVHSVASIVGEVFTDTNANHREAAMHVNVEGTVNVLQAAYDAGAKRVVVTSSASTRYQPNGALANEDSPAIGDTIVPDPYVTSKVRLERAIADFSRRTNLRVITILPGGLFGPRDAAPSMIGRSVVARLNGDPSGGVGLAGTVPFVDVRDVARAHVRAMEIENPHDAYLLVAESIEMQDWHKLLDRITGIPLKSRIVPASVAMPMAVLLEVVGRLRRKPPLMNRNTVRHTTLRQQYDCTRTCDELGITFTPSENTIRDMVRWFVDHGYVTNEKNLAILKKTLTVADAGKETAASDSTVAGPIRDRERASA